MRERAVEQSPGRLPSPSPCARTPAPSIIPILKGRKGAVREVAMAGGYPQEIRFARILPLAYFGSEGSISNKPNPRRCAIIGLINPTRDSERLRSSLRRSGLFVYSLSRRHRSASAQ
jgi:hypothetical protein